MDTAGALDAELAAKSARIAELEARVSLLEVENARLRKALARGGAMGRTGEEDPRFGRLAAELRGSEHEDEAAEKKPGGSAACDVIEVSDDEEGPAAVDASRARSPEEEGVAAVPTPRKRAARAVTGVSEDEDDAGVGSGRSSKENSVGLEDDDVVESPRGRKRAAARVVTSDSEDEDASGGGDLGSGKDGVDDQEGGGKPSKKRGFYGICDSDDEDATGGLNVVTPKADLRAQIESDEDEDDMVPIRQVLKKMRKESGIDHDDGELGDTEGCSTPATRRSARLVKNQSKGGRAARRVLNFVEPKENEGSEDDTDEEEDMEDFIVDDDSSENARESAEESCDEPEVSGTSVVNEESSLQLEESDSEVDYADVMARIGRKNKDKDWKFEGDMLAAFNERPELCLKAVCALYRKQTEEEQMHKATIVQNKEGFNQIDASRGSRIAEFLLDGDLYGPLKKTVSDLEQYDRSALEFCRKVASRYSKQLFAIYQNKEDPYFHP